MRHTRIADDGQRRHPHHRQKLGVSGAVGPVIGEVSVLNAGAPRYKQLRVQRSQYGRCRRRPDAISSGQAVKSAFNDIQSRTAQVVKFQRRSRQRRQVGNRICHGGGNPVRFRLRNAAAPLVHIAHQHRPVGAAVSVSAGSRAAGQQRRAELRRARRRRKRIVRKSAESVRRPANLLKCVGAGCIVAHSVHTPLKTSAAGPSR